MRVGRLGVHSRVQFRDNLGRFRKLNEMAAHEMARDMVETTARYAHEGAATGPPRDDYHRRQKLTTSIYGEMRGTKAGEVGARAEHGASIEVGASPHQIPGAFGRPEGVMHPGNDAEPFLRPALERLRAVIPAMLRKWYPW